MDQWKALLLVYRELDVRIPAGRWRSRRYRHVASDREIDDALVSFRSFPALVADLTDGAAAVVPEVIETGEALRSLTRESDARWWPSPTDTAAALDKYAPPGAFESIFVLWPARDLAAGTSVPCDAWGLAIAASDWSHGATYAAICNAPTSAWLGEAPGEVWLHEWLHGVCGHFAKRGYAMPTRDADGAELHGYTRSATRGWCDYYRDLMRGIVIENNENRGIPLAAWRDNKTVKAA